MKTIKYKLIAVLFFFCGSAFSQSLTHEPLNLPYKEKKVLEKELGEYKDNLYKKYSPLFKHQEELDEFCNELLGANKHFFEAGQIYYNWTEAEEYVLSVCKTVLGADWTPEVRIKFVRSAAINAFMIEDGTIYINVGLLAYCNNEAELAAVLAHEWGHYKNMDSYRTYNEWLKAKKQLRYVVTAIGLRARYFSNLRQFESQADDISIEMLKKSQYNPYGFANQFGVFKILEEKYQKSKMYEPSFFNTHPAPEDRISKCQKSLETFDTIGKKFFAVNKDLFLKVKRRAIDESVLLFMQSLNFQSALELCYRELLLYPDDEFYLFYITESIRRQMLQYPKTSPQQFITDVYRIYSPEMITDRSKPYVKTASGKTLSTTDIKHLIFYNSPKIVFYNDNYPMGSLPKSELTSKDTLPFVTNTDAYTYFYDKLKSRYGSVKFIDYMKSDKAESAAYTFSSNIPYLNSYNTVMTEMEQFYKRPDLSLPTGFMFYDINSSVKKTYPMGVTKTSECCADTMRRFVDHVFYRSTGSKYQHWIFDSIVHTKRNKFLLYLDALIDAYSDNLIRLSDLKSFDVDKQNEFKVDPLRTEPEMIDILKEYKFDNIALVDLTIVFNDLGVMGKMPGQGMTMKMMGGMARVALSEVTFTLNIHYIDYVKKVIKQSLTSHTVMKKENFESELNLTLMEELDRLKKQD